MSASNSKHKKKWKWDTTELKYFTNTSLSIEDIKQLCITRGEEKRKLHKSEIDLIIHLTSNYDLDLTVPFDTLTNRQLSVELKLRGLNHSMAKKSVLISRLTRHYNISTNTNHTVSAHKNDVWLLQSPSPSRSPRSIHITALNTNVIFTLTQQGFFNYNIVSKKWEPWSVLSSNLFIWPLSCIESCLDTIHQRIIVYHPKNINDFKYQISHIDIRSKKYENSNYLDAIQLLNEGQTAKLAFMKNEIHIIERCTSRWKHIVLNQEDGNHTVDYLHDVAMTERGALITVPSREMLLLFGDFMSDAYIYSIKTRKWRVCQYLKSVGHLRSLRECASVVTMNERYIILFGGVKLKGSPSGTRLRKRDDILVIDLDTWNVVKSKKKCPMKSDSFIAVITNSTLQRNSIVFGYVRESWKTDEFAELMMPPDYIIKLIVSWYSRESVHLFNKYSGMHCMMNVDDIMKDVVEAIVQ